MSKNAPIAALLAAATVLCVIPAAGWVWNDGADEYGCSDSLHPADSHAPAHSWSSISGSGTSVSLSDDSLSSAISIGFDFDFYGVTYSEAYISSNGLITFLGSSGHSMTPATIPTAANPNAYIAFAWEDLNPSSAGGIYYATSGSAGNRSFIIEFNDVGHYGGGSPVTAQVELREGGDEVFVHYLDDSDHGDTHTVGIEDETGSMGIQIHHGPMSSIGLSGQSIRCAPIRDADGDGFTIAAGDCDDTRADVNPSASELCDGFDNDCDGDIDEGHPSTTYYADTDGDGFGDPLGAQDSCLPIDGYVTSGDDCNDNNATAYPGAPEVCDGIDNNCDGAVDEGLLATLFADADGDGFGDPSLAAEECGPSPGYVANGEDCNDADPAINPNALEVMDGRDNNCNGRVDEQGVSDGDADTDIDAGADADTDVDADGSGTGEGGS